MKTTKLLILTIVISLNTVFAQENTDSPHLANDKAPELATFDINKLSYSFEQSLPDLSNAFLDLSPADRADGITVGNLTFNGNKRASIMQLSREIEEGKHGKYDGMLISHQGKLVFESYYRKGRINLPHFQASVTKAYISLAIGRAIQLGYLTMKDLNKPITHLLKDIKLKKPAKGAENITLHHLLSMRSGIRVSADDLESIIANGYGSNPTQEFLKHSAAISFETQTFKYQGIDPRITWQVLDSVVPGSAEDFMKNEVLAKIGVNVYGWKKDVEGSNMTSRDMLKLGALVMNKGKWNDEQIISAEYLARATSNVTKPTEDWIPDNFSYGYFWYQTEMSVKGKSYKTKFAWGGGGQYIVTVEELDLIVVITGHDGEDKIMAQISETIIPAFANDEFPLLKGPYLGQKPPGLTPKAFAPGIVNTEDWGDAGGFSPDMNEFYVTRWRHNGKRERKSVTFKKIDNRWHEIAVPDEAPNPYFSPDGKTLYFGKRYKERTKDGWSEMKSLGPSFEEIPIMGLTASRKGTLVFDEFTRDGNGILRYSRLVDGNREAPKVLGKEINTGKWNAHPFIAPDESYIMWDGERESGYGDSDIYISFRQKDGSWGKAINLGDKINTEAEEGGPKVTPDGKYLFFNRMVTPTIGDASPQSDLFWVDAQIIENLRSKQ
ncbi:serine hydrolase [Xanthovirga aplysinae]|uniref:serine hydrolase n=1 Tax=Xanthovirga aplysinae TaxID=2529853 RepID=UPI0012BC0151|nr:serine hydrolase [Xanthovirga aplysinae]MTI30777.1 class C beta-lactamase-related serine hydrolase [Xanthovirga aplysinae]